MKIAIMNIIWSFVIAIITTTSCSDGSSQQHKASTKKPVGGPCEGCEAIHESPIPFDQLTHIDTLPGFNDKGEKIVVSGTVYQKDGKTPAKDVIIYVYQTDQSGVYPVKENAKGWARRHGYIRGWMRTNDKGFYQFYTLRPASYPNSTNPQHIHIIVKEPGLNEYWIDDYHFSDDPLVTADIRKTEGKRAGSGLITLTQQKELSVAVRDIILGLNIPDYP